MKNQKIFIFISFTTTIFFLSAGSYFLISQRHLMNYFSILFVMMYLYSFFLQIVIMLAIRINDSQNTSQRDFLLSVCELLSLSVSIHTAISLVALLVISVLKYHLDLQYINIIDSFKVGIIGVIFCSILCMTLIGWKIYDIECSERKSQESLMENKKDGIISEVRKPEEKVIKEEKVEPKTISINGVEIQSELYNKNMMEER